jgi:hypothetical protein
MSTWKKKRSRVPFSQFCCNLGASVAADALFFCSAKSFAEISEAMHRYPIDARITSTHNAPSLRTKKFELEIKISALARARGSWYKSEEKANKKQTSHAR